MAQRRRRAELWLALAGRASWSTFLAILNSLLFLVFRVRSRSRHCRRMLTGALLVGAAVVLGAGCATSPTDSSDADPGFGFGGSTAVGVSLTFNLSSATLAPRETRTFAVVAAPAAAYEVRFSILPADPNASAFDASLDHLSAITDALGRASITLTAPSQAQPLILRAQTDSAVAVLPLSISTNALTSLQVTPNYTGGRAIKTWTAGAFADRRCSELVFPFREGADYTVSSQSAPPLLLADLAIPTGRRFAVALRGDELVAGCSDVSDLPVAGTKAVTVALANRAPVASNLALELELAIDANDPVFREELSQASQEMSEALQGDATSETDALLDALRGELDSTPLRSSFDAARAAGAWSSALAPAGDATPLANAIARWALAARPQLLSLRGLEARLTPSDAPQAKLELERIGGVAVDGSSASAGDCAWSLDPADQLAFSSTLSWSRSTLLATLMRAPASAETGSEQVDQAFAVIVDCAGLAGRVAAGKTAAEKEFTAACGKACWVAACEGGLGQLWQRAQGVSADTPSTLELMANGQLTFSPDAHAASFDGTWAAALSHGPSESTTQGTLEGVAPR